MHSLFLPFLTLKHLNNFFLQLVIALMVRTLRIFNAKKVEIYGNSLPVFSFLIAEVVYLPFPILYVMQIDFLSTKRKFLMILYSKYEYYGNLFTRQLILIDFSFDSWGKYSTSD